MPRKRKEWSRKKRNKVLGGLRRFIDGDSTLMASMAREERVREREEECQENRMRSIRLVIRRIHAVPLDDSQWVYRSIGKGDGYDCGDSGQENQIKSDLRAIRPDLRAGPFGQRQSTLMASQIGVILISCSSFLFRWLDSESIPKSRQSWAQLMFHSRHSKKKD